MFKFTIRDEREIKEVRDFSDYLLALSDSFGFNFQYKPSEKAWTIDSIPSDKLKDFEEEIKHWVYPIFQSIRMEILH